MSTLSSPEPAKGGLGSRSWRRDQRGLPRRSTRTCGHGLTRCPPHRNPRGSSSAIIAPRRQLTVVAAVSQYSPVTGLAGIPLSFVVLGLILILFAIGYAAMSRHVHNAGAFFAHIPKDRASLSDGCGDDRAGGLQRHADRHRRNKLVCLLPSSIPSSASPGPGGSAPPSPARVIVGIMESPRRLLRESARHHRRCGIPRRHRLRHHRARPQPRRNHHRRLRTRPALRARGRRSPGILDRGLYGLRNQEPSTTRRPRTLQAHRAGRATVIAVEHHRTDAFSCLAMVVGEEPMKVIGRSQQFGPDLAFVSSASTRRHVCRPGEPAVPHSAAGRDRRLP